MDDRHGPDQDGATCIERVSLRQQRALTVQCLNDVSAILPAGRTIRLDGSDVDEAMFPEPVFLDDRPVEADEEAVGRLRDLELTAGPQKHVDGRSFGSSPAATAIAPRWSHHALQATTGLVFRRANTPFRVVSLGTQLPASRQAHAGRNHVTDRGQLRPGLRDASRQRKRQQSQCAGTSRHR